MSAPNYQQANPTDWLTRLTNLETNALSANPISDQAVLGGRLWAKRLATPAAPTVTVTGGAAGTQTYAIVARIGNGGTAASAVGSSSGAGPTTLDATHFNTITWAAVAGATSYDVYRASGGATQGLIANVLAGSPLSVIDNGLVGGGVAAPSIDSSASLQGIHQDTQVVYSADGAIVAPGSAMITKSTAAALTLALPTVGAFSTGGMDGMFLEVVATVAAAHTVTTPSNGLNGASHIATFASAVGNNIRLRAYNGVWYVVSSVGITLS